MHSNNWFKLKNKSRTIYIQAQKYKVGVFISNKALTVIFLPFFSKDIIWCLIYSNTSKKSAKLKIQCAIYSNHPAINLILEF